MCAMCLRGATHGAHDILGDIFAQKTLNLGRPAPNQTSIMATKGDFQVAEISLADFGRKDIELSEYETPGLMACRTKYAADTFKGARIAGSLHMTVQTAVLIETMKAP